MGSWFRLEREIINHWIYKDPDYLKAWIEMLSRARYKQEPKTDLYEGVLYTLNFGEFIYGRSSWSNRLGVGERKLRTLIQKLLEDNMIVLSRRNVRRFSIYKIINFEKYNPPTDQATDQQNPLEESTPNEHYDQQTDHLTDQQPTNSRPSADQQTSSNIQLIQRYEDINVLSKDEQEYLEVLKSVDGYPFDLKKDLDYLNTLKERYPEIDPIEGIRDWATYKIDKPLKKDSNPRSQINTSFQMYRKWAKHKKEPETPKDTRKIAWRQEDVSGP